MTAAEKALEVSVLAFRKEQPMPLNGAPAALVAAHLEILGEDCRAAKSWELATIAFRLACHYHRKND